MEQSKVDTATPKHPPEASTMRGHRCSRHRQAQLCDASSYSIPQFPISTTSSDGSGREVRLQHWQRRSLLSIIDRALDISVGARPSHEERRGGGEEDE